MCLLKGVGAGKFLGVLRIFPNSRKLVRKNNPIRKSDLQKKLFLLFWAPFGAMFAHIFTVFPGTIMRFGAPVFELEVFRKQMHCTKESTFDTVGPFWRPTQ